MVRRWPEPLDPYPDERPLCGRRDREGHVCSYVFDHAGTRHYDFEHAYGWHDKHLRVRIKFAWYDLWVGAYWDRHSRTLYVCPLPMLLFEFRRA